MYWIHGPAPGFAKTWTSNVIPAPGVVSEKWLSFSHMM
jgi:hypothetical protein